MALKQLSQDNCSMDRGYSSHHHHRGSGFPTFLLGVAGGFVAAVLYMRKEPQLKATAGRSLDWVENKTEQGQDAIHATRQRAQDVVDQAHDSLTHTLDKTETVADGVVGAVKERAHRLKDDLGG